MTTSAKSCQYAAAVNDFLVACRWHTAAGCRAFGAEAPFEVVIQWRESGALELVTADALKLMSYLKRKPTLQAFLGVLRRKLTVERSARRATQGSLDL